MGRNRGGAFERGVCYSLTAWWLGQPVDEVEDVLYWRTAGSGGRATTRAKRKKKTTRAHCGDIGAVGEEGRELTDLITFELKYGYNGQRCTLSDLIDRPAQAKQEVLEEWIEQVERSRANAGTPFWGLIHQRWKREPLLYLPGELFDLFDGERRKFYAPIVLAWAWVKQADGTKAQGQFAVVTLSSFLRSVSPGEVRKLAAGHGRAA